MSDSDNSERKCQHEQRELHCERCCAEYATWFAPNELWNRVMGHHGAGFLCMNCFTREAEQFSGVIPSAWVVIEESEYDRRIAESAHSSDSIVKPL